MAVMFRKRGVVNGSVERWSRGGVASLLGGVCCGPLHRIRKSSTQAQAVGETLMNFI